MPFGGVYRLIDFALSNLVNGGHLHIAVLTQYKSHSLDRHVAQTWRLSPMLGNYVAPVPAQMRRGRQWFAGSADAIYQNFNLLQDESPNHLIVVGADHIYRMDPRQLVDHHIASGAEATVAAIRVPLEQANQFGIIEAGGKGRIRAFREKPDDPVGLADAPGMVFASMGNYVFTVEALMEAREATRRPRAPRTTSAATSSPASSTAARRSCTTSPPTTCPASSTGPRLLARRRHPRQLLRRPHGPVSVHPNFNLYNRAWPILTLLFNLSPRRSSSSTSTAGVARRSTAWSPPG